MLARLNALLRRKAHNPTEAGLLLVSGPTVPTDGEAGYATGCLFQHTDGGAGTALYVNEGTLAACNFDAVTVA
jgi:hypothetical protein